MQDIYDFEARCDAKWAKGRVERGLAPDAPFSGDPILEARDETPDLINYIRQAIRSGRIPETVGDEIIRQVYGIDLILGVYVDDVG